MDARQRFLETNRFGKPDRNFILNPWLWQSTRERWTTEGLPPDADVEAFFGSDRRESVPVNVGLVPGIDREVLRAEGETWIVRRGGEGQIIREFRHRADLAMPQWLDYPLHTRDDWERDFKPRLDPKSPARYPLWWEDYVASVQDRDYPLGISAGSLFGWIRNWMGLERLSYTLFDDPSLVHEMVDHISYCVCETIHKALHDVRPDFATMWEDMAGKAGPLESPAMFRKFQLPGYKRITGLLREHGVEVIMVDSDGLGDPLVPLWLEGGVSGLYPWEVAAGEDCVRLRQQYGKSLVMWGGIDKRALIEGPEAIDREVFSKVPWLILQGGYIPWVDHLVPPDVSFQNFAHFQSLIRQISEDPEHGLHEAKRRGLWSD